MYKTCIKTFKIWYTQYKNPEDKQPDLYFPFEKTCKFDQKLYFYTILELSATKNR